jgi:hypothetical protein
VDDDYQLSNDVFYSHFLAHDIVPPDEEDVPEEINSLIGEVKEISYPG